MKLESKIEVKNRKSAFVELKDYCVNSMGAEDNHDFLEVTEWSNGEGYDIHIFDALGDRHIEFTWGQYKPLKKCIKAIDKNEE